MSALQKMMAQRAAARAGNKMVPKKIVDPVAPTATTTTPSTPTDKEGLAALGTKLAVELSAADAKVQAQREAGVYDLPAEAHDLMGSAANDLINTMQELDAAIIEKTPEIRTLSRSIRQDLERYPELTHILSEEQLHIVVQGYLVIANVKTTPATKQGKTAQANKKADAAIKAAAAKSIDELF